MDIVVLPKAVHGEMLRGKLLVKYSLFNKENEEVLVSNRLVKSVEDIKIYRSTTTLNNLGKNQ